MDEFDDFINKNHYIGVDVKLQKIFETCEIEGITLEAKQINKLIDKLIKGGKTKSPLSYDCGVSLAFVTKKYLLTQTQVDSILDILNHKYNKKYRAIFCFKWIDNLIKNKYIPTKEQIDKLASMGCTSISEFVKNDKKPSIKNFINLCELGCMKIDEIASYFEKNKLIADNECLKAALTCTIPGKKLNAYNFYYTQEQNGSVDCYKILKVMFGCGLKPDMETYKIVRDYIYLTLDIYKIMIQYGFKFDDELLFNCIRYIGDHQINIIKQYSETNELSEKLLIIVNNKYFTINYHYHNYAQIDMNNFYDLFLKSKEVSLELCDYACKSESCKLFEYLVKENKFKLTDNSLENACMNNKYVNYCSDNYERIKKLIDLRAVPTKKCVISLKNYTTEMTNDILNLFIQSGLKIDYDIIDMLLANKIVLEDDLTRYGLEYDNQLYYIIHKNMSLYSYKKILKTDKLHKYLGKLNKDLHAFREQFKGLYGVTENKIQELTAKYPQFKFDQYCFDNLLVRCSVDCHDIYSTISWLMSTYEVKPTIITITRTEDPTVRNKIYKLFEHDIVCDSEQLKKLYIKV
jgi:hypothetical protein